MKKAAIVNLVALLFVAGIIVQAGSSAQAADTWARLGVLPSGATLLASDGANTSVLYTYGSGGIRRSTDGGATWAVCNREARAMFVLTPLPGAAGPARLYATTPGGLRTTEDGCKTWRDMPTSDIAPSSSHIRWLASYPNNQSVMYAGLDGLGGIYRTTDAGTTWEPASNGLPAGAWITSLVADPATPANVFIGVKYAGRSHPPSHIYKSTDGGISWRSSARGMYITPNNDGGIAGLAWSGGNLLAATAYDGLYTSTDRGTSWAASTTPRGQAQSSGTRPTGLRIDSLQGTWEGALLINTSEGAYGSMDGGQSWQAFGPEAAVGRQSVVTLDMNSGQALLGTGGSLYSYRIATGTTLVPTSTPQPISTATPTPPLPPRVPTATSAPASPTVSASPTAPGPSPTVPIIDGRKPTDRVPPLDPSIADYFEDTGHNISHGFRDFWKARGGIGQFGFPITEEFTEGGVIVQYFQRARFEYRDGKVVLGRVGTELTQGQFFRPIPFFVNEDDNVYFGATGHSVSGPFLEFWRDSGQEELLGYPLSESFKDDGSEYQWFERVRFEWHPYLPEGKRIVLGNLGTELLQARGWLPKN